MYLQRIYNSAVHIYTVPSTCIRYDQHTYICPTYASCLQRILPSLGSSNSSLLVKSIFQFHMSMLQIGYPISQIRITKTGFTKFGFGSIELAHTHTVRSSLQEWQGSIPIIKLYLSPAMNIYLVKHRKAVTGALQFLIQIKISLW